MIKPGIYSVGGRFGSGKTNMMNRWIRKLYFTDNTIIFTNIKLNYESNNIFEFPDNIITNGYDKKGNEIEEVNPGLLEVLKLISNADKLQRKNNIDRQKRIRFFIFLDEAGILFNQHNRSKFPKEMIDYLLQVRKLNVYLFLASQKYKNIAMQLREHVDYVFYFEPFMGIFNTFGSIRRKQVDVDGNIEMYVYEAKDENGNWIKKEKPLKDRIDRMYKPFWFKYYDDLYLNKKLTNEDSKLKLQNFDKQITNLIDKSKNIKIRSNKPALFTQFTKSKKNKKFTIKKINVPKKYI